MRITTAAKLWSWPHNTSAGTAKQSRVLHMKLLLNVCSHSVESVTRFSVRAMSMSEKVIMGGGAMDDETLLTLITGLPARLSAARDDVKNRDMDMPTAMAYLQRVQNLAVIANGTADHSDMLSH